MLNIGTNGNVDEGSTGLAFLTNASQPSFLRVESNQLKFNFADPNSIAIYLSGSLTTVYLNYQLYK